MNQCEYCRNLVEKPGKYSSGRFCNRTCANRFVSNQNREEKNRKIAASLAGIKKPEKLVEYECEKCGISFTSKKIRKSYKKHCQSCKRPARKRTYQTIESILHVSKRTALKILKRANLGCSMCSWNETSCDIHHIQPKKQGGSDLTDNLVVVCPNCHRKAHENKYSKEQLLAKSIKNILPNWIDFYQSVDSQTLHKKIKT